MRWLLVVLALAACTRPMPVADPVPSPPRVGIGGDLRGYWGVVR
ncbi:hypothetical protein [Paracraurococcus ruber]|nr:hypothetical protein [Paracraurococcus ruber]